MKTFTLIIFISLTFVSCKKQDEWLDKKSSKTDVVPSTLDDFQALLDNEEIMNDYYPCLGLIGADNYTVSDASFNKINDQRVKNVYSWQQDIYNGSITISINEWSIPYKIIAYSNIVLEGIEKIGINETNSKQWNNLRGSALFFRAFSLYNLSQLFCKPYDAKTADSDLGIPIRLKSDLNILSVRSTIKQTYDQILKDLLEAESLLPDKGLYQTRPSKVAVSALLAKTYLLMENYENALKYSESALAINNTLIDFNTLPTSGTYSLPNYKLLNTEILFFSYLDGYSIVNSRTTQIVSQELYNSYENGDLRKKVFYRGTSPNISFTGNQTGNSGNFSGLATNELYLIKSESLIRLGNIKDGLETLNQLLKKRWAENVDYIAKTAVNEEEALKLILNERRKEMPFTSNSRWEDLRRFNKDSRFVQTLTRTINGELYSLPPNDPRYVYPIPPLEILKSSLEQNIR